MSVTVATDENFKNEVLESDRPALVDFWVMVWSMPNDSPVIETF